jgi:hypothetical protein
VVGKQGCLGLTGDAHTSSSNPTVLEIMIALEDVAE